jgi:transcriptional regulator
LTEEDILTIFSLRESGLTQTEIGKRIGVTQATISRILLRKNWKHVTPINPPIFSSV